MHTTKIRKLARGSIKLRTQTTFTLAFTSKLSGHTRTAAYTGVACVASSAAGATTTTPTPPPLRPPLPRLPRLPRLPLTDLLPPPRPPRLLRRRRRPEPDPVQALAVVTAGSPIEKY